LKLVADRTRAGAFVATGVLPFALVLYLALANGGYAPIVRTEVGIVVWWIVLLGALVGVIPVRRVGTGGWLAIALLGAFICWMAIGFTWTESVERSFDEVARVTIYLGVLVYAVAVQGSDGLRRTVAAVGAAIGVVGVIALLSRFEPSLFPPDEPARFFSGASERLNYPLNYWNGLAALMAVGIPLLLAVGARASSRWAQALATAGLPVLALVAFYTFSRAAIPSLAVGMLTTLALGRPRGAVFAVFVLGVIGGAVAIGVATQFDSLEAGLDDSAAASGGDAMLAITATIAGAVGLLRLIPARTLHLERIPHISPRAGWTTFAVVVGVAIVVVLAAGGAGQLSDRWQEFKDPRSAGEGVERFASTNGAGRYQQWGAAIDAFESKPLTGIGAGTYEFWWAREAPIKAFVRDAHSLYLEVLGELGIIGLALLAAFLGVLITGAVRGARDAPGERSIHMAGIAGAITAFAVAAALDWAWELTVIPVAVLLVGGAALGSGPRAGGETTGPRPPTGPRWQLRLGLAVLAVAALAVLATSLLTLKEIDASRAAAQRGDLQASLDSARAASDHQPWSATAELQEALVFEQLGDLERAAAAATDATADEPTNWRTWLILSRIEAERGNAEAAISAYRTAASLNPRAL
jgi:hypothetical protein